MRPMKHLLWIPLLALVLLPGCAALKQCASDAAQTAAACIETPGGWGEYAACAGIDEGDEKARAVWENTRAVFKPLT